MNELSNQSFEDVNGFVRPEIRTFTIIVRNDFIISCRCQSVEINSWLFIFQNIISLRGKELIGTVTMATSSSLMVIFMNNKSVSAANAKTVTGFITIHQAINFRINTQYLFIIIM